MAKLTDIIKDSLSPADSGEPRLTESYVANSKQFTQTSEMISQKTKDAHTELYKQYIETLNQVSAELDTADRAKACSSHSDYRSLKIDEISNMNAVYLHELYFANCFDPMSEIWMDSLAFMRLQRDWGTFENWQKDFMACALSAKQGWVITAYSVFLKRFVNLLIDGTDQHVLCGMYPVIVIDMHEHAFFRDCGNDKKEYLKRMMIELNWEIINERFKRAEKVHEAVK